MSVPLPALREALLTDFPPLSTPEAEARWAAALRRRSWAKEQHDRGGPLLPDHEPLEWLGDRVLNMTVAELLWERHAADRSPGALTEAQRALVDQRTLAQVARDIGLADHLEVGVGERLQGQHLNDGPLSDHVEALIAACFLSAGWPCARWLVARLLAAPLAAGAPTGAGAPPPPAADPKSELNLWCQKVYKRPLGRADYEVVERGGLDHAPIWRVAVVLPSGERFEGELANNRKDAERTAAERALQHLR